MNSPRVLVTSRFLDPGSEIDNYLRRSGLEPVFKQCHTEEEMIAAIQGMDAIICSSDPLSARVIESANRLKVIARTGVFRSAPCLGLTVTRWLSLLSP